MVSWNSSRPCARSGHLFGFQPWLFISLLTSILAHSPQVAAAAGRLANSLGVFRVRLARPEQDNVSREHEEAAAAAEEEDAQRSAGPVAGRRKYKNWAAFARRSGGRPAK
jgi:hypothetical protein